MEFKKYLPNTATEYINFMRTFAALTEAALNYVENKNDWVSKEDREKSLATIAENVGTIASFRGDHAAYYQARPEGLIEFQKEMYSIEDSLRNRLFELGYK